MKVKTSELTGAALDWTVAKCAGERYVHMESQTEYNPATGDTFYYGTAPQPFYPSTDWSRGGPIIERELMAVRFCGDRWVGYYPTSGEDGPWVDGPTPLIAAMRCYVASKLGDEIEVPDELLK